MKSSCPTTQYINQVAKAAAGMGESACDVEIGGVRVTVHVPFEGPLPREVALPLLQEGAWAPRFHQNN